MITVASAEPTLRFDQAIAITRAEPLKPGMSKRDVGDAVGADLDDAREQRERLLRRQIALERAAAVAAAADRARDAFHAVDQQAVEVADVERQLALAVEIVVRIGRLEVGEVEDADVDGGDRDVGFFARARGRRS